MKSECVTRNGLSMHGRQTSGQRVKSAGRAQGQVRRKQGSRGSGPKNGHGQSSRNGNVARNG
jgi:hypothetical protein